MITPLFELKNIQLNINDFSLTGVNLDLFAGEIHAIMGENGSGKSILMQLVTGVLTPNYGEIFYKGKPIVNRSDIKKDIIYVPQNLTLMDNLSVAENLFFSNLPIKNKLLKLIDYEKLDYMFDQLIKNLDLPFDSKAKVSSLGLAQRQMIQFLRAYIADAKIVILDEPSAALTHHEKVMLYQIVEDIRSKGVGIFFITHCIDDVLAIANRISVIRHGMVVGTEIVADITEEDIIKMLSIHYIHGRYPKLNIEKGRTAFTVKNIGFKDILKNVNFSIKEGEILGITGLAGSGRSLLANCLFGAIKCEGEILIHGKKVEINSPIDAIKNDIALVPEDKYRESLFKTLNTIQNVALPSLRRFAQNQILDMNYLNQFVLDYMDKTNISPNVINDITKYSGGNLQKAIVTKWMMSRAKIFIMDEPTRGIDYASKVDIYNIINDLLRKKATIIYISSDIEEIFGICDRVAV
nr:sugar ABC transporter ATP-binding protein [Vallitaleaceae bacterium]